MKAASTNKPAGPVGLTPRIKTQADDQAVIETALYAGIVIVAALLRFGNLAAAPLTTHEAEQALAAWRGLALPPGGSPLLYSLNQILFGLFGSSAGDAGVRGGAALFGTLLVLVPLLYRRAIGRAGALAATGMLAISPTLTYASRLLDGQIVAVACGLAAIGFGWRFVETRQARNMIAGAIALGIMLTSGPGLVTIVLVVAIGAFVAYRWAADETERLAWQSLRVEWALSRRAMLWGGAGLIVLATALLIKPTAIRDVPESISSWVAAWRGTDEIGPLQVFQLLPIYEPLIVLAGLGGVVVAMRRGGVIAVLLAVWSIGALLVTLMQPGRQAVDLAVALAPLALLGGLAIQRLIDAASYRGVWMAEGAIWLITGPLAGYLVIILSGYAIGRNVVGNAQLAGQSLNPLLSFVVLAAILSLIIAGVFSLAIGFAATLRASALSLLAVLIFVSFGNMWSVTQLRVGDPRELMWGPVTTTNDVHALIEGAEAASIRTTGQIHQASVWLSLPQRDPVIEWYLRKFANVTTTGSADAPAAIAITPLGTEPPVKPGEYLGAKFVTRKAWSPATLTGDTLLRWLLYREADQVLPVQTLILWVRPIQ